MLAFSSVLLVSYLIVIFHSSACFVANAGQSDMIRWDPEIREKGLPFSVPQGTLKYLSQFRNLITFTFEH